MNAKTIRLLNIAVWVALIAAALYVSVRWLLPWLLPFVPALLLAAAIEPAVSYLCRRGVKREVAAGICVLGALALLGGLLWLLLDRAAGEVRALIAHFPAVLDSVSATLEAWKTRLLGLGDRLPPGLDLWLEQSLEALREGLERLPARLSERLLSRLSGAAAGAPGTLLFAVTALIGFYFASASYPSLLHAVARALPERFLARARLMRRDLRRTLGRWLKAQAILLLITFAELIVAFWLLHVNYALVLAFATALIDALPVLGTGTVLLPWALYDLLTGETSRAIGLAVTYAAVTVLRNSIQPKLLGDQLGLHPLLALAAIYAGWKAWGVWGMLVFPIFAITGKQLFDSGLPDWKHEKQGD